MLQQLNSDQTIVKKLFGVVNALDSKREANVTSVLPQIAAMFSDFTRIDENETSISMEAKLMKLAESPQQVRVYGLDKNFSVVLRQVMAVFSTSLERDSSRLEELRLPRNIVRKDTAPRAAAAAA